MHATSAVPDHRRSLLPLPTRRCAILTLASILAAGCQSQDRSTPVEPTVVVTSRTPAGSARRTGIAHVLLLSIDGLHAIDLARFIAAHPNSALAKLSRHGNTFMNASTTKPSDSFPGTLAELTGATPRTTGVYYDDSYDRLLSPPRSNCSARGTEVVYDESIDRNPDALDAGGGIDPSTLPLDPAHGCTPVYPHQFLRVNTIFEVAKAAHLRTAWSDKHPAYDIVNGPSGHGVDDLYTPEIASVGPNGSPTDNVPNAEAYDDLKVTAILNEIAGHDHAGTGSFGAPAIFGMNFQAVSVGQKTAGYVDASGAPTPALADALAHTDSSIGSMVEALRHEHLLHNTLLVVSAKHGQSPIDPSLRRIVSSKAIPNAIDGIQPGLVAQATEDDIALVWLTDQSKTEQVVGLLDAERGPLAIDRVLSGGPLEAMFGSPLSDSRTPDLVAQPLHGVIYTKLTATKRAEHGGFLHDDTNVPILVAGPGLEHGVDWSSVQTTQIAPTILQALGLDPRALQGVQREGTQPLPLRGESDSAE